MENKRIYYDFCPVCSGLMKNGVCLSCGHEKGKDTGCGVQEACSETGDSGTGPQDGNFRSPGRDSKTYGVDAKPQRRTNRRILAGVGVGILLALLLLCTAVYMIAKDVQKRSSALIRISGTADTGVGESYVPDPADAYYVELADARREDLSYHVDWQMYNAENEAGTTFWSVQFPVLSGEVCNLEEINQDIEAVAHVPDPWENTVTGEAQKADCHIQGESFVTYMDEEKISIVFRMSVYLNGARVPQLYALNFDVREGERIKRTDMVEVSPELVRKFRLQNAEQNSLDLEEAGWSDGTLLAFLQGENGFAFYTPVGLEVGFNYREPGNYGWVTVTIKNP